MIDTKERTGSDWPVAVFSKFLSPNSREFCLNSPNSPLIVGIWRAHLFTFQCRPPIEMK